MRRRPGEARLFTPPAGVIVGMAAAAALATLLLGCRKERSKQLPHCTPGAQAAGRSDAFNVVFDRSYGQTSSPFDTGFGGMGILATALRKEGATVSVNSLPLASLFRSFRGPGNVLVLGIPALRAHYTNEDLAGIDAFLAGGGGVLAIVEHDNIYGNADFQTELLERHDIAVAKENALGAGTSLQETFWPWAESSCDLGKMRPFYAAALKPHDRALPLTTISRPQHANLRVTGAIDPTGRGKLVAIGDYEFLWNMAPPLGITLGENLTFAVRLFRMLAERPEGDPPIVREPTSLRAERPKGSILFSTLASALRPDSSPSGLLRLAAELNRSGYDIAVQGDDQPEYAKYDLVVLACPTAAIPDGAALDRAKRLLLAANGLSSLTTDPGWSGMLDRLEVDFGLRHQVKEPDYPLNRLTRPAGFAFAPETLISRGPGNPLQVRARWRDGDQALLRGAAWISWTGSGGSRPRASPSSPRPWRRALPLRACFPSSNWERCRRATTPRRTGTARCRLPSRRADSSRSPTAGCSPISSRTCPKRESCVAAS